jgi:hypothetical protein
MRFLGVVFHPFTHIGWGLLAGLYVGLHPETDQGLAAHLGLVFLVVGINSGGWGGPPPQVHDGKEHRPGL